MGKETKISVDAEQILKVALKNSENALLADLKNNTFEIISGKDKLPPYLCKASKGDFTTFANLFVDFSVSMDSKVHVGEMFQPSYIEKRLKKQDYYYVLYSAGSDKESHQYVTKVYKYGDWKTEKKAFIITLLVDYAFSHEHRVRELLENSVKQRTHELSEKNDRLNRINEEIIGFLGNIVEARDAESGEHVRRVRGFTYILAEQMMQDYPEYGLTPKKVELISSASALHDIGKIMIPDSILLKAGSLSENEFETMKTHSEKGCEILKFAPKDWSDEYLLTSLEICKYHHEKYDGKGYPLGLLGDDIPISAQIVSIVDCLDALINVRCYKPAYAFDDAYNMILGGECGAFSDKLLRAFIKCKEKLRAHAQDKSSDFKNNSAINADDNPLAGFRILVVDDDEISSMIISDSLSSSGAIVTVANSGEKAVDMLEKGDYGVFDAVLMDIYMPGMDGFETTKAIRKSSFAGAETIPIIAVSTSRRDIDIATATEVGMSSFIFKPVTGQKLSKALISSIRNRTIELQHKLTKTKRLANRDVLTGVRSLAAYTDKVEELKESMKTNKDTKFALVECDINGLKNINDTYGHEIGDVYIVNSCRGICSVFKHSPVYRIGGDEFVVVLEDEDYEARKELMEALRQLIDASVKKKDALHGRISLAAGMAEYNPKKDKTVGDVLKRADTSMYNNKRMMHMTVTD